MSSSRPRLTTGPFLADQLRSGDPYELSHGHPVHCAPTGRDGTAANGLGFSVLDTDPAVQRAGVDTGLALSGNTLRAPDVAVGFEDGEGTWATRAKLALEYAGRGQDEAELRDKIAELLEAGTRWVWVVRLVGVQRVEVHEKGAPVKTLTRGAKLEAPGVLQNPVPVEALFDRAAAHEVALVNLLQRRGYRDLDEARGSAREEGREEGREAGREEGQELARAAARAALRELCTARGWALSEAQTSQLEACDLPGLLGLIAGVAQARTADELLRTLART
jgi:hypothetical protein